MSYPICKKCKNDMSVTDEEHQSSSDSLSRIYECDECGLKVQALYNFEEITPTNIFWEDE